MSLMMGIINIEFKKGLPSQNRKTQEIPSIAKDLLKLLFEKSQKGIFFHILEHVNSKTLSLFLERFKKAANNKQIRDNQDKLECKEILLFIVILENNMNGKKYHSRCLEYSIDFSSLPIKKIKLDD